MYTVRRCRDTGDTVVKILIAEDDEDNRDLLREILDAEGYGIVVAANAADAVATALAERPALILMDLQMPESGVAAGVSADAGLIATRTLRDDPRTSSTPVIALTGHDPRSVIASTEAAGCDAIEVKPYNFRSLLKTIDDLLSRQ